MDALKEGGKAAKGAIGSLITGNATDGTKVIFYKDIIGIQIKEPGITIGYMQFETASNFGDKNKDNFWAENTFTYEGDEIDRDKIFEMFRYIVNKVEQFK